jgi:uncharacterized protein (TIGR00255 family)
MTGFGQAEGSNARHAAAVTLRGVNHRFLDLVLRLRDEVRASEAELRDLLAAELHRGRVELAVEVSRREPPRPRVEIDGELVRALHRACHEMVEQGLMSGAVTLGDLVRLPEAVRVTLPEDVWDAEDEALVRGLVRLALDQFQAARGQEGERLARLLAARLDELAAAAARLESRRDQVTRQLGESLRLRLQELLAGLGAGNLDEARLAQEAALLVDKSDVREELDRLTSHLEHFRAVAAEGGAIGKRLDFLTQEIFRELNTLGAKCRDAEMVRWTLDAKVLCEQLREQVQNVE